MMRIVLGLAAALALTASLAVAQDRAPVGTPAPNAASKSSQPRPATRPPTSTTSVPTGPGSTVKSARDDRAIRAAEERDRRREERMLRVTGSICRGC